MEDERKPEQPTPAAPAAPVPPAPIAAAAPPVAPPAMERLSIDEFRRVELRAGKILECERVPKSNKLLKMLVEFGTERRQIVGGIGKKYAPEQLVGRTCPFVFNLQPAKLMGVESDGMIMAGNLDGEPVLLQFLEDVPPGSKIT